MGVKGLTRPQGPGEQDVLRGRGKKVLPAGDMSDLVIDIVDRRCKVVGGGAVAAEDHEVVDVACSNVISPRTRSSKTSGWSWGTDSLIAPSVSTSSGA